MTDEEFEELTAPTKFDGLAAPVNRGPFYLDDVEKPVPRSTCPNANNPFGHNRECACNWWMFPEPFDAVEQQQEQFREWEANQAAAEIDRQMGWEV